MWRILGLSLFVHTLSHISHTTPSPFLCPLDFPFFFSLFSPARKRRLCSDLSKRTKLRPRFQFSFPFIIYSPHRHTHGQHTRLPPTTTDNKHYSQLTTTHRDKHNQDDANNRVVLLKMGTPHLPRDTYALSNPPHAHTSLLPPWGSAYRVQGYGSRPAHGQRPDTRVGF